MAPITWPLTMMGSAPGCGKSFIKVGARFSPLRTILLVSEVGRRRADCRLQAIVGRRRILASQPDQTKPDQTRPDQTRPTEFHSLWRVYQSAHSLQNCEPVVWVRTLSLGFCGSHIYNSP